jgi:hypothetical protein
MNTHITVFELISLTIAGILIYTLIKTILQELTKYK